MKILITGGTGLLGTALTQALLTQGVELTLLSRSPQRHQAKFHTVGGKTVTFLTALSALEHLDGVDAVVNLAGEPIFARRWTPRQKAELQRSRLDLTCQLSELINLSRTPPRLISASAGGIYGDRADEPLIETAATDCSTFSARLAADWEAAALQAQTRVCLLRTGTVLSPHGGALSKILPLFRCGLGGKFGNGRQYWSWIALEDAVAAILFLLANSQTEGIFNLAAPTPVTNVDFTTMLAQALHRPHFSAVPACGLRLILGERAEILLNSQRMLPQRLRNLGFDFRYPTLPAYFTARLGKPH